MFTRNTKSGRQNSRRGVGRWHRPRLEALEERILLASDVVVGRTLSSWSVADIQNNELKITYTVYNQQATEVSGVLLTTTLEPGVTFVDASVLPDRNGQEMAWSLGTLDAFGRASVEVTVSFAGAIPLQLDDGAEGFGTLNAGMVTDAAPAAMLRADAIAPELLASTPDANTTDPFVQEKAAELDYDPQRIFDYLNNEVGYESYVGSLRGARGTMWSSAGNSLDEASLGVALFRASGIPARYAHGTLSDELSRQRILSMFLPNFQTVGYLPLGTQTADPANDPKLLADTRDHYWVQFDSGSGFRNADTSGLPGSAIGTAFAAAVDTFAEVSDLLRHKVRVALDAERYSQASAAFALGNGLGTATILAHSFNTVDLVGRPISIGHLVNTTSLPGLVLSARTTTYSPYLAVGDEAYLLAEQDNPIRGTDFQQILTNFPFGSTVLTGLFLRLTLTGPDGPPEAYEWALMDRIGFAARQGLTGASVAVDPNEPPALNNLDVWTLAIAPGQGNPRPSASLAADLASEASILGRLPQGTSVPAQDFPILQQQRMNVTRQLALDFLALSDLTSGQLAMISRVKAYFARPRIVIVSTTTQVSGETATSSLAVDLRRDTLRVVAAPGSGAVAPQGFNIARGLMENAAERQIVSRFNAANGITLPVNNTAEVFAAAQSQNIAAVTLTAADALALDEMNHSAQAKARINAALQQGFLIVVPSSSVDLGGVKTTAWYQMNPATGETIGVTEDGGHKASTEYATVLAFSVLTLVSVGKVFAWYYEIGYGPEELAELKERIKEFFSGGEGFQLELWIAVIQGTISKFRPDAGPLLVTFDMAVAVLLLSFLADPPADSGTFSLQVASPFPSNASMGQVPAVSSVLPGTVSGDSGSLSGNVRGPLIADWNNTAVSSFQVHSLTIADGIVTASNGNVVGSGAIGLSGTTAVPALLSGDNHYSVRGNGGLSFYGPAASSLGVSGTWDNYTATVTGDVGIALSTDGLTLNGLPLPAGTYTILTNSASLSGSGQTTSPTFAGSASVTVTNGTVELGAGTGNLSVGGTTLDLGAGTTLTGYTGSATVAAGGGGNNPDGVTLSGVADNLLRVTTPLAILTADQNTPVSFSVNIDTSLADDYTLSVEAPDGWTVTITPTGQVTATPKPGLQSGSFPIRIVARSQTNPVLVAQTTVTVAVTATEPGITLAVDPDTLFTVPTPGGAESPTAFRASVRNLGPAADKFTVSVTDLPTGFDLHSSGTSVEVPAGETGILGVYLRPNGATLPAPGTPVSFTVTATSTTSPTITETRTVNFNMPDVHGITFTATPDAFGTVPGNPVTTTLTLTAVGNVSETVNLSAALSARLTATGLPSTVTLIPGQTLTIPVALTPAATTPLNSSLGATITAKFNPLGDAFDQTFSIPVRVAAPGADAIVTAANAADQLGNTDLANRLDDLAITLTNLVQTPASDIFKSQSLAALTSILSLLAIDEKFVAYVDPLAAARDQLAAAVTVPDVQAAVLAIGAALDDFAVVVTNLAKHNFDADLFPNVHIAQPQVPVDYAVRVQNTGTETTTYNLAISGLPASVTSQFSATSLTVAPGQIGQSILTLTQTSNAELLTFDFTIDVSAANVSTQIQHSVIGTMQARNEHVSVPEVSATPPFGDPGTSIAVSAKILNAVNQRRDVLVSFTVLDPSGQVVFASSNVAETLTVQASVLDVPLGSLDTTGFAKGQYTIAVTVTEPNGTPIPGGTGRTTLLVGSPLTASLAVSQQQLPPGTHTITNTLEVAALVAPAEQLRLVGQLTHRTFNNNSIPLNGFDVVVRGDYAYFADDFVLMTVDVSNPAKPTHVGPLLGFAQHLSVADGRLVSVTAQSGGFALRFFDLANPANPVQRGAAGFAYLNSTDLAVIGNEAFVSTNLEILDSRQRDVTEQFGDVLAIDLTAPFNNTSLDDVLFNTFGTTSSGDEDFGIPRNGGPFNHFGLAVANPTTLYAASTTSTGTNVNLDQNGNPAKGIIRIIDVSIPTNLTDLGQVVIPGTIQVQQIVIDGDRAYVLGSQGGWKDPFTNSNDIGPVGNVVMAVLDVTDRRNPTVIGTPTVLDRYARGMTGLVALPGKQFAFASLGQLTDTPQLYLIDASDPANLTVEKQFDAPGQIRNMSSDGEHLYVASNEGLFIYSLGHPDIPVTASVQIPKGTGVEVVPGSFDVAPTTILEGTEFDTLVWDLTLTQSSPTREFTWQTTVSALQPGESRPVTLDTSIDFVALGTASRVTLPAERVFAEQVLALAPAAQTARPGATASYTVTLANPTSLEVTYDLAVLGVPAEWVAIAPQVTVSANSSVDVPLTLTTDPFAPLAEYGFVVTASAGGTSGSVQGALTLAGNAVLPPATPQAHGVVVAMTSTSATAGQGTSAVYTVRVTNTGSATDTFALSIPAIAGITTTFSQTSAEVAPGASNFRELTLVVTPTAGTVAGTYPFTVLATSGDSSDSAAGAVTVVDTGVSLGFDPTRVQPGDTLTLSVTNTGQITDTFDLVLAAPVALVATLPTSSLTLAPGEMRTVLVTVGEIDFAFPGDLPLVAIATSRTVPAVRNFALTQIAIGTHTGLEAKFEPGTAVLPTPGAASFVLLVDNLGNVEGEFTASILGTSGPVSAQLMDLEGKPATTIPIFRLPGLASGAILLRANLQAAGEGTVTVQVRSQDGTLSTTTTARVSAPTTRVSAPTASVSAPIVVPPPSVFIFGASAGPQGGKVTLPAQDADISVLPFEGFDGEVRVARGDVNNDGVDDTIYGAGLSRGGHVKVIDGQTGTELASFLTFERYQGGVYVGCDDVNNDGFADVIVGAGSAHQGGHVKVFDGKTGAELYSFFAFEGFGGAVRVAGGDTNGDGFADVIVGAGAGDVGGHVKVIDGKTGQLLRSFFAYDGFAGGIFVAAADLDGDGKTEVVTGADEGAPPHVKAFSSTDEALMSFLAYRPEFRGGVRVGGEEVDGDDRDEILTANGFGAKGHVTAIGLDGLLASFFVTHEEQFNGIFVA